MPSPPLNFTRIRRNILTYASLGVFCVALVTAVVLAYPSFQKQRSYSQASLRHVARIEALSLGEYVRRLEEISLQITSRTRARDILAQHNRGEVTQDQAQKELWPILSDALNRGQEVVGIQRLDAENNHLLSVGETVDPLFWPPVPTREEGLTLAGPIAMNGQWRLIARVLIREPGMLEPMGTDIVTFTSDGLAAILARSFGVEDEGLAVLAAEVNGEWRFLQGQSNGQLVDLTATQQPQMRDLFRRHVIPATTPTAYYEGPDFGFAASVIPGMGWRVLIQRDLQSLYAELYSSLHLSLAVALVLAAVGAVATMILIRPLSTVMAHQAEALERRVAEKTSSLEELTGELDKARRIAEEASEAKSRFLATTSHELRTPLNAIMGYADLIRGQSMDMSDTDRIAYYGDQIHDASEQLMAMISGLLDFSKVEAGKVTLSIEPVDLRDVLGMSMRTVAVTAERRNISLTLDVAADLTTLDADREALRQMVTNLLSNAVKFTRPSGRVVLRARRADDGAIVIEVADSGIGMTAEEIKLALQPFEQVDNALNREFPGTGLGLSLVDGLADLHGGRLELQSEPGIGTRARLIFPKKQAMAA